MTFTACTGDDGDDGDGNQFGGDGDGDGDGDGETQGDPECGNGVVESGEECDLGDENANSGACTGECMEAVCGDGLVRSNYEECDDANEDDNDDCLADCTLNTCGDGILNENGSNPEECDDGNDDPLDECDNDCELSSCGDGIKDDGEQCDDGNESTTDGCVNCQLAFCGDGYIRDEVEECDDGNEEEGDDCTNMCNAAFCGDGIVHLDDEECDDGNDVDTDDCTAECTDAYCGDGIIHEENEECDDGNNVSEDGCAEDCDAEYCFGVYNTAEEDIEGNDWFDTCVETEGDMVIVMLRDADNNIVYEATGTKPAGDWTTSQITSTNTSDWQYHVAQHDRIVPLDNGDWLMISSKTADALAGCGTDLGNGYTIVIYPEPPNYYFNPKLIVAGYRGGVSNEPRGFTNWTEEYEISYWDGASMNTCNGSIQPFEGFFTLEVEPSP
jgi:cysteine-rich repeat protein